MMDNQFIITKMVISILILIITFLIGCICELRKEKNDLVKRNNEQAKIINFYEEA